MMYWCGGAALPDCALKASELGLTVNICGPVIMSVTGTVCIVAFSAVSIIVAEYTPTPKAVGLTETLSPPGTKSFGAPSLSQLLSLGTVALKLSPAGDPERKRD